MSSFQGRSRNKFFNDSVHGHIELPHLCVKIIDTPIFQRLRHLKQMGFVSRVYPGAGHTRFEHSLGVCYLAGEIVNQLNKNRPKNDNATEITEEEKLCLQIAGLCHDLGHGPFSHTWEKFMGRVANEQHRSNIYSEWKHESMSEKLFDEILKSPEIASIFAKTFDITFEETDRLKERIKNMITGKKPNEENRAFLYEIISNSETGIDVDKWDYFLRDTKHLNINITFDSQRLMQCQRIMKAADDMYHIFYRNKVKVEIYQMYMMRAEIHRKACLHPVAMMIEEMWVDALLQLNKDGYTFHGKRLSEVHEDLNVYIRLTDALFDTIYHEKQGSPAWHLLERIKTRKLYKIHERKILETEKQYKDLEKMLEEKREKEKFDLYVTKLKVDAKSLNELKEKVHVYNKQGIPDKKEGDWSSVPTFISKDVSYKRLEALFFSKSEQDVESILNELLKKFSRKRKANDEPRH